MGINQKIQTPFQLPFFAVLICFKWLFVILYQYPLEDMWHQKTLAINFANGYGVNYIDASVNDLSLWTTETLFKWPPLTAILTGLLTNIIRNVDWAVHILDCVAILILFSAVRSIIILLQLSVKQQWYIWLLFLFNPLLTDLFSTSDLLSLSFWMCSFYLAFRFLLSNKPKNGLLIFMILVGFLPAAFRYQYYTLIFILPVCFLLFGVQLKLKRLLYCGMVWATGMLFLLIIQIIVLRSFTGGGIPVTDIVEFSPNNLTRISPFFLYSFFPAYLIINTISGLLSIDIVLLYQIAGMLSLIIFCFYLIRIKKQRIQKATDYFFSTLTLVSVFSVFMMLCILSLYYRNQMNGSSSFTYVQEPRYWGVVFVLLPILFISDQSALSKKMIRWLLFIFIFCNAIFSIYRVQKTNTLINNVKSQTKKEIIFVIEQTIARENRPVIITYQDKDFTMYNFTKPYATVHYDSIMKQSKINTTKPIWFFLITGTTPFIKEEEFINNNQLIFVDEINYQYRIYRNR